MRTWGEVEKSLHDSLGRGLVVYFRDARIEGGLRRFTMQIIQDHSVGNTRYYDMDGQPFTEVELLRSQRFNSVTFEENGLGLLCEAVLLPPGENPKTYALRFQGHLLSSHDTEEDAKAAKYDAIHIHGYNELCLTIEKDTP